LKTVNGDERIVVFLDGLRYPTQNFENDFEILNKQTRTKTGGVNISSTKNNRFLGRTKQEEKLIKEKKWKISQVKLQKIIVLGEINNQLICCSFTITDLKLT